MNKLWKPILVSLLAALILCIIYTRYGKEAKTAGRLSAPAESEVPMHLSAYDTATVLSLAKEYLDYIVERDYNAALGMLYVLDEDNHPVGLDTKGRQQQLMAMTLYPVYGYEIEKLVFWRETDSRLDYCILISKPSANSEPARVRCALRPVRYADVWYLTVADDRTTRDNSEISL